MRRSSRRSPNHRVLQSCLSEFGFVCTSADAAASPLGWYSPEEGCVAQQRPADPTPCTFTSITPAWNNDNLGRLACKITSPLVFAHVRAAYPGMPVSEQNCHPFQVGRSRRSGRLPAEHAMRA